MVEAGNSSNSTDMGFKVCGGGDRAILASPDFFVGLLGENV